MYFLWNRYFIVLALLDKTKRLQVVTDYTNQLFYSMQNCWCSCSGIVYTSDLNPHLVVRQSSPPRTILLCLGFFTRFFSFFWSFYIIWGAWSLWGLCFFWIFCIIWGVCSFWSFCSFSRFSSFCWLWFLNFLRRVCFLRCFSWICGVMLGRNDRVNYRITHKSIKSIVIRNVQHWKWSATGNDSQNWNHARIGQEMIPNGK